MNVDKAPLFQKMVDIWGFVTVGPILYIANEFTLLAFYLWKNYKQFNHPDL